jgi:hypothetical protein
LKLSLDRIIDGYIDADLSFISGAVYCGTDDIVFKCFDFH